jgi:hypothetical protein
VQRAIVLDESSPSRGNRNKGVFAPAAPSHQHLSPNASSIPSLSVNRFRHTFSEGSIKCSPVETTDSSASSYRDDGRILPVAGRVDRNERKNSGTDNVFVVRHVDLLHHHPNQSPFSRRICDEEICIVGHTGRYGVQDSESIFFIEQDGKFDLKPVVPSKGNQ